MNIMAMCEILYKLRQRKINDMTTQTLSTRVLLLFHVMTSLIGFYVHLGLLVFFHRFLVIGMLVVTMMLIGV